MSFPSHPYPERKPVTGTLRSQTSTISPGLHLQHDVFMMLGSMLRAPTSCTIQQLPSLTHQILPGRQLQLRVTCQVSAPKSKSGERASSSTKLALSLALELLHQLALRSVSALGEEEAPIIQSKASSAFELSMQWRSQNDPVLGSSIGRRPYVLPRSLHLYPNFQR